MNSNYTYIIASMPLLTADFKPEGGDCSQLLGWIRSQLDEKDAAKAKFVESGFTPGNICKDFYLKAFASKSSFVREFFAADLRLRNAKVRYLNRALGRPSDKDVLQIEAAPPANDDRRLSAIFDSERELLERERMMDGFLWETADALTRLSAFRLDNVLALVAKLCIINRWLILDPGEGAQMLRRLTGSLRETYGKIEFKTI